MASIRPRLLDVFCGAGGCSVGFHRAGFDVLGVDLNPQPNYPFEFIQTDALEALAEVVDWGSFDGFEPQVIHASPPCQAKSTLRHVKGTPEEYREAMGIDWASRAEIAQAIPPAYAQFVGEQLLRALDFEGLAGSGSATAQASTTALSTRCNGGASKMTPPGETTPAVTTLVEGTTSA